MSYPTSHDDSDDDFEQIVLKPQPRRPFELSSPRISEPPASPAAHPSPASLHAPTTPMDEGTPSRTRSFLNLTSSTLFGIYQPTDYNAEREDSATPWGTGAQTPLLRQDSLDMSRVDKVLSNGSTSFRPRTERTAKPRRIHHKPRRGFKNFYLPLLGRVVALFGVGILYGMLLTHLHDRGGIAPTRVPINRASWRYLTWWGCGGIALGEALPWVDLFWTSDSEEQEGDADNDRPRRRGGEQRQRKTLQGLDGWMDVVRSIGAFVGVAFAIRKLPWQSTLQLSLTLALANPAIWFIVDRSPPGFALATSFAVVGTGVLLGMNPALMPSPSPAEVLRAHVMRNGGLKTRIASSLGGEELILGVFTEESVGVATWIASVFFISSVCFGNIGRRLALQAS